ncbi:MAG: alpha/beta fold hydrolase [Chloroflexota bacterium]
MYHLAFPPRQPAPAGRRPPRLLLLHGVGSHEEDLFSLAPYLDPRFHILSLRAPLTLSPGSYAWYEIAFNGDRFRFDPHQVENARQVLMTFIQQAPQLYEIDPERVYLLGFSQGAIMSLTLALTQPELLAGVVAIAGRTLPELFRSDPPLGGHLAAPAAWQDFPLLVMHGLYDPVLPIQHGRATRDHLARLPVALTYKEYDMGHYISEECLGDAARWLTERGN